MPTNNSIIAEIIENNSYGIVKLRKKGITTILYRIPRCSLNFFSKNIKESKNYGAYILLDKVTRQAYIGRSEKLKQRSKTHNKEKDFWTEMIVVTAKEKEFDLTDIAYLEHTFYNMALSSKSYTVKNDVNPSDGNASDNLDQAIKFTKDCLNVLGYDLFEKANDLTDCDSNVLPENDRKSRKITPKKLQNISIKTDKKIIDDLCSNSWAKKREACKKIIEISGYTYDKSFTFASYHPEKNHKVYWADAPIEYIEHKWTIALVYKEKHRIHLCKIEPHTFSLTKELAPAENKLRTRIDKESSKFGAKKSELSKNLKPRI